MRKRRIDWRLFGPLLGILSVLLGIAVWWIVSAALEANGNRALPSPDAVFSAFFASLFGPDAPSTYLAILVTTGRFLVGFLSAFLLGGLLGIASHRYEAVQRLVAPWNALSKVFPTAALSLVLIVVFSRNGTMMNLIPSLLSFLVVEPIVYEAFFNGLKRGMSKDEREALLLDDGGHSVPGLLAVELPAAGGYILTGVAQSLALGIKVTIMSEVLANFSNVTPGIGSLIVRSQQYAVMDEVIAYSLLAVLVSALFDLLAFLINKAVGRRGISPEGNGKATA